MSKLLCIGSVNLDHTYEVPRIVCPGETIACSGYHRHWGGKGLNQALALARAGAEACLAARVSHEDIAALRELCRENGLDASYSAGCGAATGHAVIQVDADGQNCIVIYGGANVTMGPDYLRDVLSRFGPGDLLLLQNEVNDVPAILRAAGLRGITVALNPSPVSADMAQWPLERVGILILNEVEGEALTGQSQPDQILDALAARCPDTRLVLTLGGKGSRYRWRGENFVQPIYRTQAVDTTAAGDTFTGYFLAFFAETGDVPGALSLAAKAAALAVSRKGAVSSIPFRGEVDSSELSME